MKTEKDSLWKNFSSFFDKKELFYKEKELVYRQELLTFFIITFFLVAIRKLFLTVVLTYLFYGSAFLTIIIFFFTVRQKWLIIKFLPFLFFIFVSLSSQFLFLATKYFENESSLLKTFNFLFSSNIKEKIADPKNLNEIVTARRITYNFIFNLLKLSFLSLFVLLNFGAIKTKMKKIKEKPLGLVLFFCILVFWYSFSFYSATSNLKNNEESRNEEIIETTVSGSVIFFLPFLTSVIVAPLWEEFIYRYLIFNLFGKKNYLFAACFSIFVFGFIHIHQADIADADGLLDGIFTLFSLRYLVYFWGGFIAVLWYWSYDLNLFYPIFWHAFHNMTIFLQQ